MLTLRPTDHAPSPLADPLADANLTQEQRRIWNQLRSELQAARARIVALEAHQAEAAASPSAILTRPEFNREVARMLAFDERYGGQSSVLYLDVENLSEIATHHGRAVANAAVRALGEALLKNLRGSDLVGRLAADEFGILLAHCDNAAAWRKGEKIAALLCQTLTSIHNCALQPRISYGAYTFQDKTDLATGLKQAAATVTRASLEPAKTVQKPRQ